MQKSNYVSLALLVSWLSFGESSAQTSIELAAPWSGSYISNSWLIQAAPGKPGIAVVPSRFLLQDGQDRTIGELVDRDRALAALYGPDLILAVRELVAATATSTPLPGSINAFRVKVGPILTLIDAVPK